MIVGHRLGQAELQLANDCELILTWKFKLLIISR